MRYLHAKLAIPDDWTGQQALAVVDLLDLISAAVWGAHEEAIIEAIHQRDAPPIRPNDLRPDEDLPF